MPGFLIESEANAVVKDCEKSPAHISQSYAENKRARRVGCDSRQMHVKQGRENGHGKKRGDGMSKPDAKDMYNLACRVKGTCSPAAVWHGLRMNRGLDRLRFLKSRVGEVWRGTKVAVQKWQKTRGERNAVLSFAEESHGLKIGDIVKPIALYLPQFHTFPENDEWWGRGFTEWTNVKKAKPLFDGHYQPHIPHPDIGYYDLSDVNVMRRQADIAKKYGIYGFCFYYYHFANGKRLLEKPLDNWLSAKDIDLPFCYCWANENWTRAWDGGDKEVIMPQDYGRDNLLSMFANMLTAFKDSRYIKVGGGGHACATRVSCGNRPGHRGDCRRMAEDGERSWIQRRISRLGAELRVDFSGDAWHGCRRRVRRRIQGSESAVLFLRRTPLAVRHFGRSCAEGAAVCQYLALVWSVGRSSVCAVQDGRAFVGQHATQV